MCIKLERQGNSGYALLLMLIVLMGIGGVVAAGFTQSARQEAERERYLHNKKILEEAKRALLQYAYNYPQFNLEGPGRLPCPDFDDDGTPNNTVVCNNNVGRLPWAEPELNFYDARDASNERLWYAVSSNFRNVGGGGSINSGTLGRITIEDRSGGVIYDGTATGVAAVIIAPGPAIDRAGVPQDRIADPDDPVNYLDLFGAVDNADFVSGTANGFVMGPIEDLATGTVLVNDQIAVVTTDEVIAMAEKAMLQTYREALESYSDRIRTDLVVAPPAPWNDYYPWLFNYAVTDLDDYPADQTSFANEIANHLTNIGRVPSLFGNYFTEASSEVIESELYFDFTITYPVGPGVGFDRVTPSAATGSFFFNGAAEHQFSNVTTLPQRIQFTNIAGQDGRLEMTAITNQTISRERWFWDDAGSPTGVWTPCPIVANNETDCNRDSAGNPTPGSATNDDPAWVLRVIAAMDFTGTTEFDINYNSAPAVAVSGFATAAGHATIDAVYQATDFLDAPFSLDYEIDRNYDASFDVQETGTLEGTDFIVGNITLGLRYYPELPAWVAGNDWHESVLLAYAPAYRPNQIGAPADCSEGTDCIEITGIAGNADNKIALLVIGGENDWVDGDTAPQVPDPADFFFTDEVDDVFNPENADLDRIFDIRTVQDPLAPGDTGLDKLLVVSER